MHRPSPRACRRSRHGWQAGATLAAAALLWTVGGAAAAAGTASAAATAPASRAPNAVDSSEPIDINSAGKAKLMSLPGIGRDEAERIVAGRPYFSKADLATRGVLAEGVVLALRHRIIARQPPVSRPAGRGGAASSRAR